MCIDPLVTKFRVLTTGGCIYIRIVDRDATNYITLALDSFVPLVEFATRGQGASERAKREEIVTPIT